MSEEQKCIYETVSEKVQELVKIIKDYDTWNVTNNNDQGPVASGLTEYAIREMINWGSWNHYEALGIALEAVLQYREIAQHVAEEENEDEEEDEDNPLESD